MRKVIVRIGGGIGNQMFECAYGRFLADLVNGQLIIDKSPLIIDFIYNLLHLNFKYLRHYGLTSFFGPSQEKSLSPTKQCAYIFLWLFIRFMNSFIRDRILEVFNINWSNILGCRPTITHIARPYTQLDDSSTILCSGVPLDIPLLPDRQKLKKYFSFSPSPMPPKHNTLFKMIGNGENWCSIHVRRSDYLLFGGELETSYYTKAIAYMQSNAKINNWLVFSDDIDWCKQHFDRLSGAVFFDGDYRHPIEDLRFMTLCRYHVIANSTFSWWGAYLAGETDLTVYPDSWYTPTESNSRFPKSWIAL